MSVELLQTISMAAYIIAGILAVVAVALFFVLDIRKVYGDISGTTARKAIEEIRRQNEDGENKAYKPSYVNLSRGRVTDKISPSGRLLKKTGNLVGMAGTEKFATEKLNPMIKEEKGSAETTVLAQETTFLPQETTVLFETTRDFVLEMELGFTGSNEQIV